MKKRAGNPARFSFPHKHHSTNFYRGKVNLPGYAVYFI